MSSIIEDNIMQDILYKQACDSNWGGPIFILCLIDWNWIN